MTYSGLLETSTGLASGLSLTLRAGNGVENQSGATVGTAPFKTIIGAQYMFDGETFTIDGLTAGEEVKMIGYGLSNRNWGMSFSSSGTNPATANISNFLVGPHYNASQGVFDASVLSVTPVGTSLNGTWFKGPEEGLSRVHVLGLQIFQASAAVPEPSSFVLGLLSLVGLGFVSLRRNRRRA